MRFKLGAGALLAALAVAPLALALDFGRPGELRIGAQPADVVALDINEDAYTDLVTAHASTRGATVAYGTEEGTFDPMLDSFPMTGATRAVAVVDANEDGYPDIALANVSGNRISLLLGDGTRLVPGGSFAVGASPYSIAAEDVSGDGHSDLVTANVGVGRPSVSVLLGRGDGTFERPAGYQTATGSYSVALTDLDGDGSLDIVSTNSFANNLSYLMGNGDGTFQEPALTSRAVGSRPRFVTVIEGEEVPVLYVASLGDARGVGSGIFELRGDEPVVSHRLRGGPSWLTVDDFDEDALMDIIATLSGSNEVVLIRGAGGAPDRIRVGKSPGPGVVADLNGDGELDLAVVNRGSGSLSLLLHGADAPRTSMSCAVPRLALKTLAQARSALTSAGCTLGAVARRPSRIRRGRVIAQRPRAGMRLPVGASVAVVVSRGPRR